MVEENISKVEGFRSHLAKPVQKQLADALGDIWNRFLKDIPESEKHPSDTADFQHAIHAAQNILFTQLYLKNEKADNR